MATSQLSTKKRRRYFSILLILILLLAAALRLYAAYALPVDFDEPVYYRLAIDYAHAIRDGDLGVIIAGDDIINHPSLAKLLYGLLLAPQPDSQPIPELSGNVGPYPRPDAPQFLSLRLTAVLLGILNVLLVAVVDPLAGLFLTINTYTIKYTSQVYLEALPMLTITVSVLAYLRSGRKWNIWLFISAVTLPITFSAAAGIRQVMDWVRRSRSGQTNPQAG